MAADPAANRPGTLEPPVVLCIFGPTGVGKTELALRLAELLPLEIVSVDSALVYRSMDIGTAKPDRVSRGAVAHHLIDVRDPWQSYSAGQFRADVLQLIPQIHARGRLPVLVGGTLLYFRALLRGLSALPPADHDVRALIESEASARGWPALHAELARIDPVAAARIEPADRQRIQRALEVFRVTGRPLSTLQAVPSRPEPGARYLRVAAWPADRAALYRALDERFLRMLAAGLLAEVQRLRSDPRMSPDCPAIRAVGYRQLWAHLDGECDLEEAARRARVATRRLAKRQLTWMRAEPADLGLALPALDAPARVASFLEQAGVSRATLRCNIMGRPSEFREHGI